LGLKSPSALGGKVRENPKKESATRLTKLVDIPLGKPGEKKEFNWRGRGFRKRGAIGRGVSLEEL